MSTESGFTSVDDIHFTIVPPGCSLLNSPWINGLSRLSVVNNCVSILPAKFYLSWKRGKPGCTRSWRTFLNWKTVLENRLHTASNIKYEARDEDRLESEKNCLNWPADILYLPRQLSVRRTCLAQCMVGMVGETAGKLLIFPWIFIYFSFYWFSFPPKSKLLGRISCDAKNFTRCEILRPPARRRR